MPIIAATTHVLVVVICHCRAPEFCIRIHLIGATIKGLFLEDERKGTWLASTFGIIALDSDTFC